MAILQYVSKHVFSSDCVAIRLSYKFHIEMAYLQYVS